MGFSSDVLTPGLGPFSVDSLAVSTDAITGTINSCHQLVRHRGDSLAAFAKAISTPEELRFLDDGIASLVNTFQSPAFGQSYNPLVDAVWCEAVLSGVSELLERECTPIFPDETLPIMHLWGSALAVRDLLEKVLRASTCRESTLTTVEEALRHMTLLALEIMARTGRLRDGYEILSAIDERLVRIAGTKVVVKKR